MSSKGKCAVLVSSCHAKCVTSFLWFVKALYPVLIAVRINGEWGEGGIDDAHLCDQHCRTDDIGDFFGRRIGQSVLDPKVTMSAFMLSECNIYHSGKLDNPVAALMLHVYVAYPYVTACN